jgi:hypothetical protein
MMTTTSSLRPVDDNVIDKNFWWMEDGGGLWVTLLTRTFGRGDELLATMSVDNCNVHRRLQCPCIIMISLG